MNVRPLFSHITAKITISVKASLSSLLFLGALGASAQDLRPAASAHNIVLVHGAWADASSWNRVIPLLEKKGYHVTAVHLPFTSLADDAAAVKRAVALQDGPTLLVAHSYGGTVITEAGDDPKVIGLLYVAAFAPEEGQSTGDVLKGSEPAPGTGEVRPDANGFLQLTPKGIREDFAQDLPPAETQLMITSQGQVSGKDELGSPVSVAAWKHKPDFYIVADKDRMIPPALEATMASRMHARTIHLPTSHVAMLSKPAAVASFIEQAADGR